MKIIEPKIGMGIFFTGDAETGIILDVFDVTDSQRNNYLPSLEAGVNITILWDEKVGVNKDIGFQTEHKFNENYFKLYSTEQELLALKLKYTE